MKRMYATILILIMTLKAFAPCDNKLYIPEPAVINPFEAIWNATCLIESSGNPFAIGDKNLINHSYGIAQIRNEKLIDFHKATGIRYDTLDMFDVNKSREVYMHHASRFDPWDIELVAKSWNGSGPMVEGYWRKVKAKLNTI